MPLILLAITGLSYRLGRSWFGMDRETGGKILDLHSAEFLGGPLSVIYLLAVAVGLLALIGAGVAMLFQRGSRQRLRRVHRVIGTVLCLPLVASAITGATFKVGESWFGISKETGDLLMTIHQGSWLGNTLRPFYILLLGVGLLVLAASGLRLLPKKHKPSVAPATT